MQSVGDKIVARAKRHDDGWCFSVKDLQDIANRRAVDVSLFRLVKKGSIRRIARGLYDQPRYSNFLKIVLSPDIKQAADAIARKHAWRIQPIGAMAANLLGLSEQVPAKVVYLSDGPSKSVKISNTTIRFRHTEPKDLNVKNRGSALVIQALKYIGKARVDDKVVSALRKLLPERDRKRLLKDARYGTDWIYEVVKKICASEDMLDG